MMAEQRLIDANNLGVEKASMVSEHRMFVYGWNSALQTVKDTSPTIDPETLPLVKELREKLKPVKKKQEGWIVTTQYTKEQRDAAFQIVVKYGFCGDCRWKFESKNCVKCDCYQNAVKVIKDIMFEEAQTNDRT